MLKKMLKWFAVFFVAVAAVFAALLFVPKDNGKAYRIKIAKTKASLPSAVRLPKTESFTTATFWSQPPT